MKKIFFIFIMGLISATIQAQQPTKKNKKVNYRLDNQPFILSDTTLLDTNSIYLEVMNPENQGGQTIYTFMRFFAKGQVFSSEAFDHEPTLEEMNDLKNGQKGYYKLEKNELKIEFKTRTSTHFEYYFAKIVDNKIHLYKYKGRTELIPMNKKLDVWFEKKKIILETQPDW